MLQDRRSLSKSTRQQRGRLSLDLRSIEVHGPNPDLVGAFQAAKTARVDALIVVGNPLMVQHAKQVFDLAAKYRLPSMTEEARYVDAGGLISYGANVADLTDDRPLVRCRDPERR